MYPVSLFISIFYSYWKNQKTFDILIFFSFYSIFPHLNFVTLGDHLVRLQEKRRWFFFFFNFDLKLYLNLKSKKFVIIFFQTLLLGTGVDSWIFLLFLLNLWQNHQFIFNTTRSLLFMIFPAFILNLIDRLFQMKQKLQF